LRTRNEGATVLLAAVKDKKKGTLISLLVEKEKKSKHYKPWGGGVVLFKKRRGKKQGATRFPAHFFEGASSRLVSSASFGPRKGKGEGGYNPSTRKEERRETPFGCVQNPKGVAPLSMRSEGEKKKKGKILNYF